MELVEDHVIWVSHYSDWWSQFCRINHFETHEQVSAYLTVHYRAMLDIWGPLMRIFFPDLETLVLFRLTWIDT